MAQEVPASSTMAVPYGPMGVGLARRRMREELRAHGAPDSVVDDALLILSELLSNSCRHASPLPPDDSVRADWAHTSDGRLTISVTDGGGPTRPLPATPSVSAHGGRGLSIITSLARDWGVEDRGEDGSVTVWAVVAPQSISPSARLTGRGLPGLPGGLGLRGGGRGGLRAMAPGSGRARHSARAHGGVRASGRPDAGRAEPGRAEPARPEARPESALETEALESLEGLEEFTGFDEPSARTQRRGTPGGRNSGPQHGTSGPHGAPGHHG
ncbi:ATP-binding protein [Streptomyces sp. P38-E01]|uniref:ATP-binding protein n=2 Tax=Streptomyces tardus TaxID=2780544 RepID=A0A949JK60_9ACTN|nr:ATP-binding protein [Streptomyces tardus]